MNTESFTGTNTNNQVFGEGVTPELKAKFEKYQKDIAQENATQTTDVQTTNEVIDNTGNTEETTKQYNENDYKAAIGRQKAIQKKYQDVVGSDEYKFGLLLKEAEKGNKAAIKQIINITKEKAKLTDSSDLLDYEDEQGEVNLDSYIDELDKPGEEEIWSDAKQDPKYNDYISVVENELKTLIPKKVYDSYNKNNEAKRSLYNLVSSGQHTAVLNALDTEISSLSLKDQLAINSDPDLYGQALVAMYKKLNSTQSVKDVGSVSHGSQRPVNTNQQIDYANMSDEEFKRLRYTMTGQY